MIETLQNLIETGFFMALMAALVATPVALLALGIDRAAGNWMSARSRCWLWVIVAVRLLLPVAPGSPVSLQNAWAGLNLRSENSAAKQAPLHTNAIEVRDSVEVDYAQGGMPTSSLHPSIAEVASSATHFNVNWKTILVGCLTTVWLVGAAFVVLRSVIASLRFDRRLKNISTVDDLQSIEVVKRACNDLGVSAPTVKRVSDLPAPAIYGLLRPTLCLPSHDELTDSQLRMVALHEATHLRRRDGWMAWLLVAVRAVHWFNPIAWFATGQIEKYREQACDDAVRQFTKPEDRSEYGNLLMRFATRHQTTSSLGLVGLWFARPARHLTARITAFSSGEQAPRLPWFVCIAVVAVLAAVGLTDANGGNEPIPTVPVFLASESDARLALDRLEEAEARSESNPIEERTYNLAAAVENADTVPNGVDHRMWLMWYVRFGADEASTMIQTSEEDPNLVTITMPRRKHEFFTQVLDEFSRLGHTHQVSIESRMVTADWIEDMPGIDWQEAVIFTSPQPVIASPQVGDEVAVESGKPSVSVKSFSVEYAPFVALILDDIAMKEVVHHFESDKQALHIRAPKVTLFSGQTATILDQAQTAFVTSVDYVHGDLATAVQPNITVIDEGSTIEVRPRVHDEESLDLHCRLTLSSIDQVRNVKLPGREVIVQAPKVTRQTVSATCRMKKGESLLIASIGDKAFYYTITPRWFPDPVAEEK